MPFMSLVLSLSWPAGWLDWPSNKPASVKYSCQNISIKSVRPVYSTAGLLDWPGRLANRPIEQTVHNICFVWYIFKRVSSGCVQYGLWPIVESIKNRGRWAQQWVIAGKYLPTKCVSQLTNKTLTKEASLKKIVYLISPSAAQRALFVPLIIAILAF